MRWVNLSDKKPTNGQLVVASCPDQDCDRYCHYDEPNDRFTYWSQKELCFKNFREDAVWLEGKPHLESRNPPPFIS